MPLGPTVRVSNIGYSDPSGALMQKSSPLALVERCVSVILGRV